MSFDIKKYLLTLALVSCSQPQIQVSTSDVNEWGNITVIKLSEANSDNFKALIDSALIPNNTDFSKLNLFYNQNTNTNVKIENAEKLFLRNVGIISSIAEHCNLNWADENFLPMMQWQRSQLPPTEQNGYKIAIIGTLHGHAQATTDEWLSVNSINCEETKRILANNLFVDLF